MTDGGLRVVRYEPRWERAWDDALARSANGTFLSARRFLSYHPPTRFVDHSLLVTNGDGGAVVALVPAAESTTADGPALYAHPGATFGGVVLASATDLRTVARVLGAVERHAAAVGMTRVVHRLAPHPFHAAPAETIDFLLQRSAYDLDRHELTTMIDLRGADAESVVGRFDAKTRNQCRLGERAGLVFDASDDVETFHALLTRTLARHDARPVHTVCEMRLLGERFPDAIRLYTARRPRGADAAAAERVVAGAWTFRFGRRVFHTQYLAADEQARAVAPMNFLIARLIREAAAEGFAYFSFGVSTEDAGRRLNPGLFKFKEGFGGSGVVLRTFGKRPSVDAAFDGAA